MGSEAARRTGRLAAAFLRGRLYQYQPQENLTGDDPGTVPHRHDFITITSQCSPQGSNPGQISMICLSCDHHMVVRYSWQTDAAQPLCNLGQEFFDEAASAYGAAPMHNMVCQRETGDCGTGGDYYPLISCSYYSCSKCTFRVTTEFSAPRIKASWLSFLLDQQRVKDNYEVARLDDPDRYQALKSNYYEQALRTIWTYLDNRLDPTKPDRNISMRNKHFTVLFGDQATHIFKALGYDKESCPDGEPGETALVPRVLEPSQDGLPTELGTLRAFNEDFRLEAYYCQNYGPRGMRKPDEIRRHHENSLSDTYILLEKTLHCYVWPRSDVDGTVGASQRQLDHADHIGVFLNFRDTLVRYGYECQLEMAPSEKRPLLESYQQVLTAIQSWGLVEEATIELSQMQDDVPDRMQQAIQFFEIQTPLEAMTTDELVDRYHNKLQSEPRRLRETNELMVLIAQKLDNDELYRVTQEMSKLKALAILEITTDADGMVDEEFVHMGAIQKLQNETSPEVRQIVRSAVACLADERKSKALHDFAAQIADPQVQIEDMTFRKDDMGSGPVRLDLPVGLQNIGNTCYLNSILQYLNTLKPVRETLDNLSTVRLPMTDEAIGNRRMGSNQVVPSRSEVLIAQALADELRKLSIKLRTTADASVRPAQRLANATLIQDTAISEIFGAEGAAKETQSPQASLNEQQPVSLPDRPSSPAPVEHVEDVQMGNTAADNDVDRSSTASTKTLVEAEDTAQVSALDGLGKGTANPSSKPQKSLEELDAAVLATLDTQERSSGTGQMDVEEVMGNMLYRLQLAIQPDSTLANGVQTDAIQRLFYIWIVNYTQARESREWSEEEILDRYITAYPSETGPLTLYQALSRSFDRQTVVGSGQVRYSAIRELPPVLGVLIQRNTGTGAKMNSPVRVDETFYLDRFMDADPDDPISQLKEVSWAIQERSSSMEEDAQEANNSGELINSHETNGSREAPPTDQPDTERADELMDTSSDDVSATAAATEPVIATDEQLAETDDSVRNESLNKMEEFWSKHRNHPYSLHAAICHSGHLRAGHYWIWIRDFQAGIWRKYNDERITEESDTSKVLAELNGSGGPYYVSFVRKGDEHQHVDVPVRDPIQTEMTTVQQVESHVDGTTYDFGNGFSETTTSVTQNSPVLAPSQPQPGTLP